MVVDKTVEGSDQGDRKRVGQAGGDLRKVWGYERQRPSSMKREADECGGVCVGAEVIPR